MNPRGGSAEGGLDPAGTAVEELKRQIEAALGSVEEIMNNKPEISVATSPEEAAAVRGGEDEVGGS